METKKPTLKHAVIASILFTVILIVLCAQSGRAQGKSALRYRGIEGSFESVLLQFHVTSRRLFSWKPYRCGLEAGELL